LKNITLLFGFLIWQIGYSYAQNIVNTTSKNGNYLAQLKMLEAEKNSYEKQYKLGNIYQNIGNYNKAIFHYKRALTLQESIKTRQALAKTYKNSGNTLQAILNYKKIIKQDTLNYLALYDLGKLYAKNNHPKKATNIFDKLEKIDPSNPNYPYQKALLLQNIYERADILLHVHNIDSLHTQSLYQLANFYKLIKDKDSTRLFIEKGLSILPNNSKFLKLKITDLYKQKHYNQALTYTLHLDSLVYNDIFTKQRIGLCYWKLKDFKKGEKYLKLATKIDPNDKSTYYYLGLLYKEITDYEKAKKQFNIAINLERPDIDNEHYYLGVIAQEEKKPKNAIIHFKKSFKNNRQNYLALFELAVMTDLYYKDKSIALKYYKEYLNFFKNVNATKSEYIKKRVKEITENLFLEEK